MTGHNPFPGMNPFFERHWRNAHTSRLMYLRDALHEQLPPDLVARTEEEVLTVSADGGNKTCRPDVQVREPSKLHEPGAAETALPLAPLASLPPATEPIRVWLVEEIERWL